MGTYLPCGPVNEWLECEQDFAYGKAATDQDMEGGSSSVRSIKSTED
jgi:hypothetical protein